MKNTIFFSRFLWETRLGLVASSLVMVCTLSQSLMAQTTYTAVAKGEINTPTTWSATSEIPIPEAGDVNVWSTGNKIINEAATPVTFYGGTFNIASGGTLNANNPCSILYFNNITLNGGIIATSSRATVSFNLNNKTFTLNGGSIKTTPALGTSGTRNISFQNCSLAGSGNITIAQWNAGAIENWVEFTSTVTTTGFTGIFTVVPGIYQSTPSIVNGIGGELKISAPTSGTFGVSVPAASASPGVLSNGKTYTSTVSGKLFFNPGVGKACILASLNLGGIDIAPGTYTLSQLNSYSGDLSGYLNQHSTGKVKVLSIKH